MVPYSTAALFRFRQELCVQALGVPGNSFISARPPKYGFENKRIVVIVLLSSTIIKSFASICYRVSSNALLVMNNVTFINIATDSLTICKSNISKINRSN